MVVAMSDFSNMFALLEVWPNKARCPLNRARYTLNKEILLILNNKNISGESSGRASL